METAPVSERHAGYALSAIWFGAACALSTYADADVSGLDAGEIGGAAWTLGVAHPTGFPIDLLLLRAAALLPLGPLAFRQNLGVAWLGACVVTGVAYLCQRIAARLGYGHAPSCTLGALLSAAALLSSRTFLAAVLHVEVYATALLCVVGAGCVAFSRKRARRRVLWPLLGFALGAHITAPYLSWPFLFVNELRARSWRARRLLVCALCSGLAALIVVYLPLAARRNGAFDWGDPETLRALWRHLSAARIREAYAPALWNVASAPATELLIQLAEQPLLFVPAAYGLVQMWRVDRALALLLLTVGCLDLAYAAWINPMGISERQVGHAGAAVLALAAGSGSAGLLTWARSRGPVLHGLLSALAVAAVLALGLGAGWPARADDGYVVTERYGADSPLLDLPPRSVYVCASDSACASALYAVYAEGTRPDVAVVPAQHLWDPSVTRRLGGLPLAASAGAAPDAPAARRALAAARVQALISAPARRPLYFEQLPRAVVSFVDLSHAPWSGLGSTAEQVDPFRELGRLEHARFGVAGPSSPLARELWSRAYDALGEAFITLQRPRDAVRTWTRSVELTPERSVAHGNLGVALERSGELQRALSESARALELEPRRATPWVNVARLTLRLYGPTEARRVLIEARRRELADERLDALARELAVSYGTTRK